MSSINYDGYDLDFAGIHFEGKHVFYGLIAGTAFFVLFGLKKYFAGSSTDLKKDLTGKNVVITGGNDGIGRQTAKRLLEFNANVIIGSRDEKKNEETVQELSKIGKGKIVAFKLDLADKSSIQNFVDNINNELKDQPLHYLLNNAGLFSIPELKRTKQNLEMQIGVNHFGHFYLTYLLWGKLKKSKNPRIVNVSSKAHISFMKSHDLDFNNLHYQNGGYSSYPAYSRSKKANILFTKQLQKRMDQEGIEGVAVSLHPGTVRTGIFKSFVGTSLIKKIAAFLIYPFYFLTYKNLIDGAQTNIYCILEDDSKLVKGGYYSDCKYNKTSNPQVNDPELAQKLWIQSEKTFGIKFDL